MSAIWVAVITGALAIVGNIIVVVLSNKNQQEVLEAKIKGEIAVVKTEINTLSNRVNVHNNLIDRMYHVEADVQELKHKAERE